MRDIRQVVTLLLAVVVVLAGCSGGGGPVTTGTTGVDTSGTTTDTEATATTTAETDAAGTTAETTETTPADRETVRVTGGDLPVNQTAVFARVQRLLGTDARPQPVEVRNLTERKGFRPGRLPLLGVLGLGNVSFDPTEPGGLTTPSGKVYVHPGNGSAAEVERVLAHEFVHTTQYRATMLPWLSAIDRPRLTHDLLQTRLALIEGGAVYATDAYAATYLDGVDPSERVTERYRNGSASAKYFYARYHYGYRYVNDRLDSPSNLSSVYENAPNTTEQVLHGYARTEEPPSDLAVETNATGRWSPTRNNTMGELFVRVALQTELDAETARTAATGWGNDVLYGFTTGSEDPGFAWTLRMDSANEADELASAVRTFAERRRNATNAGFRIERVGDETVVVLLGNPAFVENATVSGTDADVTVRVE